ncbi:MAG: nitrous oxide reductase accessory protein NosL [Pseudobdellovibrionaceae bacterium]
MIWINIFFARISKILSIFDRVPPRAVAIFCGLLLLGCFYFPLWNIELYAPQYPEGLSLSIWINKISGDVQSVNTLNHYVGMKKIDANSIPELAYMPAMLAGLVVLAGLAAIIGKRWAFNLWYVIFAAAGSLGLWDFYRWEYEYGHNISADAPIKIPGMVYQPPFLGSKTMLNILAYSLPDIGGWILLAVGVLGAVPILSWLFKKIALPVPERAKLVTLFLVALILSNSSCLNDNKPEPIALGHDHCHACKMTITEARFGAEVISKTGKIYKFDSVPCLAGFIKENPEFEKIFVTDFFSPGQFVKAEDAFFLDYPAIRGPMGSSLLTTAQSDNFKGLTKSEKMNLLRWPQILSLKSTSEMSEKFGK